jgi:CheY-like chemotaxis protein
VTVALDAAGFEVCSATNGREGLRAALQKRPDVIVTDVVMPEMDGWSFVRQLRAHPDFALVPVLFLTSRSAIDDRIAGFQLGADDYLGKPVNLAELPRRIQRALAQRRQLEKDLSLAAPAPEAKGLKGTLDQVGMATLLSVLGTGRRSGILRLTGGVLRSGMLVYLVRGEIHRIEVDGRVRLTGDEALQQLFRRLEGGFEFTPMALRLSNEVNVPLNQLLFRGAREAAAFAAF